MSLNGPDKHGAFVKIEGIGSCFIDGIPDECKHDWTGSAYFISKKGKLITWKTYPMWRSCTDSFRTECILRKHYELEDPIVESGATCRKCGKLFTPPIF